MSIFGQIVTVLQQILAAIKANGTKLDTVNANLEKLIALQQPIPTTLSVSLGTPSKRE